MNIVIKKKRKTNYTEEKTLKNYRALRVKYFIVHKNM